MELHYNSMLDKSCFSMTYLYIIIILFGGEDADNEGGDACVRPVGRWEISAPSEPQFCCEPKMTLYNGIFILF